MPTTSTRPALATAGRADTYSLDNQIGFLLRRAYQRASSNLLARIGDHDLTIPQFSVLARLRERGCVSQNLLGRLVAMEPANIRDVVLRLKKRRLIRTERDPNDGRLVLLSLTPAGALLVEKLLPLSIASTAASLAPLRPDEQETLFSLLHRIV
jgi:MarR family transcriptional regulator, lower aerobic nicotinate degradation pathway regulator